MKNMRRIRQTTAIFAAGLIGVLWLSGLASAQAPEIKISNLHMSPTAGGPPADNKKEGKSTIYTFPSGVSTVYVVFDYAGGNNTKVQVRVYDPKGQVIAEPIKAYTGNGTDSFEISNKGTPFVDGQYVTNIYTYSGDAGYITETSEWTVGTGAPAAPPEGLPTANLTAKTDKTTQTQAIGGVTRPALIGVGALIVVLLGLVVWAVRGFTSASQ